MGETINSVSIGGNLSITQGNGADDIAGVGILAGSAAIGGNLSITQGNGDETTSLRATTAAPASAATCS